MNIYMFKICDIFMNMHIGMYKDLEKNEMFLFRFGNIWTKSEYFCFNLESSRLNLNVFVLV
jgi:hypothetical protein